MSSMSEATKVLGQLDPRLRGKKTHICISCNFPVSVYGRCAPCLHAFCLTCAAEMTSCMICKTSITKLERIPGEAGLFVSPTTLQGFRSEADLAKHANHISEHMHQLSSSSVDGITHTQPHPQRQQQQLSISHRPPPSSHPQHQSRFPPPPLHPPSGMGTGVQGGQFPQQGMQQGMVGMRPVQTQLHPHNAYQQMRF